MSNSPEELLKNYEEALSHQDFNEVRDLISDDAVFLFNDGSHFGIEAIENAFTKTFDLIKDEKYWLSEIRWLTRDENSASCVYNFNWTGLIGNEKASGSGRGTTILRKVDGNWLIAHEHLSKNPSSSSNSDKLWCWELLVNKPAACFLPIPLFELTSFLQQITKKLRLQLEIRLLAFLLISVMFSMKAH